MNQVLSRASESLEWGRFLSHALEWAKSDTGRIALDKLALPDNWACDEATAKQLQTETQEAMALLEKEAIWGALSGLRDTSEILSNLDRSGVLSVEDLVCLRAWLYAIDVWGNIPREEIAGKYFKNMVMGLMDPSRPLGMIEKIITPKGELSEEASPRLANLFAEVRSVKAEINSVLSRLLNEYASSDVLQEKFSDIRDGRYVLPVKISRQNEVDGIVCEASVSRQTVYVEPRQIEALNNKLRNCQNELTREIYRILSEISEKLRVYSGDIRINCDVLTYWDAVQARARMGLKYGGKSIDISNERKLNLSKTAHPLLWWSMAEKDIVKNDIFLEDTTRVLLLTGPNTGGKTVILKTIGFAGICSRTGFPFPAGNRIEIPFFDKLFADLGDPQSLEQQLSSFSGHIAKLKEILECATDKSLILIDEMNSSTDPEEGAALARAFLEVVMSRGQCLSVVTTHDPVLKGLGLMDRRILNACMHFDENMNVPTYKMSLGIPGRSRALDTAARLGLPSEVLDLAKTYVSTGHLKMEELLANIEGNLAKTESARRDAQILKEEAQTLKREWLDRTGQTVRDMLERADRRIRQIVNQVQDEVRQMIKEKNNLQNPSGVSRLHNKLKESFDAAQSGVREALKEEAPEIVKHLGDRLSCESDSAQDTDALMPGKRVRVPKWKTFGTVVDMKDDKIKVQMGTGMVAEFSADEIQPVSGEEIPKKKSKVRIGGDASVHESVPSSLDIRGIRFEEAMSTLSSYLDRAFRSGRAEVTIVHGLGTGALREGSHKILKKLPYIQEFVNGGAGRGGAGATIVRFARS